jgi:hypothetical protein
VCLVESDITRNLRRGLLCISVLWTCMLRLSCIGSGVVRGRSKLLSCRGSGQYGFLVRVVIVSPVVGLLLGHAVVWYVFIANRYASLETKRQSPGSKRATQSDVSHKPFGIARSFCRQRRGLCRSTASRVALPCMFRSYAPNLSEMPAVEALLIQWEEKPQRRAHLQVSSKVHLA